MFLVLSGINKFHFKRLVIKMFSFPQCTKNNQSSIFLYYLCLQIKCQGCVLDQTVKSEGFFKKTKTNYIYL